MPIYVTDKDGTRVKVAGTGFGTPGEDGKSAYQAAKEGGFTGSETEFNQAMQAMPAHITDKDNPHGVTADQVGAFTKSETLLPETAALFGLGADAVPDEVFRTIGRFNSGLGNEYLWAKTAAEVVDGRDAYEDGVVEWMMTGDIIELGDEVYIDSSEAIPSIHIKNPTVVSVESSWLDAARKNNLLEGKYVKHYGTVYRVQSTISFIYSTSELRLTDSGDVYIQEVRTENGYVNSPDADAYPPTKPDGHEYLPLGQLGDKARVVTGSYVGTGESGESNPNRVNLPSKARAFVIAFGKEGALTSFTSGGIWIEPADHIRPFYVSSSTYYGGKFAVSSDGVEWYASDASHQYNSEGYTYFYFAIL